MIKEFQIIYAELAIILVTHASAAVHQLANHAILQISLDYNLDGHVHALLDIMII